MAAPQRIVFSDIDGTILHDPAERPDVEWLELVAPPSVSGKRATSVGTLQKVAKLRSRGVKVVIVSGARMSTMLQRLPWLPASDAYVCDNGGRIFYPGSDLPTACPIHEDLEWRDSTGPCHQDALDPSQRQGQLWDWYRYLQKDGWTVDANGYYTNFRCHVKNGKSAEELHEVVKAKPSGLASSYNLGDADFYLSTSGKAAAARYLMKKWGAKPQDSVAMGDDHNDMELAAQVGRAFLPSIGAEAVKEAIAADPEHYVVAKAQGPAGAEEMLDAIDAHFGFAAKGS